MRLRTGSYPLRIATGRNERRAPPDGGQGQQEGGSGRGRGLPRCERICRVCHSGAVEDLRHFILECPAYTAIRQRYSVFDPLPPNPHLVMSHPDQVAVASAVQAMVRHRTCMLLPPS